MNFQYDGSFTTAYDRDMEKFHRVRSATVSAINRQVMDGYEKLAQYEELASATAEVHESAPAVNDAILEREGMRREDMAEGKLPAYMEKMLMDEAAPDMEDPEAARQRFFEDVYAVDSVLEPETLSALGHDYAMFVEEQAMKEQQMSADLLRQQSEAMKQNGARSTFKDPETGRSYLSLTDEHGEPTDDPYAFDEYD